MSAPTNHLANADLLEAAKSGDIGGIRSALSEGADALDRALVWACVNNQTLAASYLLDRGARADAIFDNGSYDEDDDAVAAATSREGSAAPASSHAEAVEEPDTSALAHLASSGYADVIELLLERGLNLRQRDYASQAAVQAAAWEGRADIALRLLDAGAWFENEPFEPGEDSERRVLAWAAREGCPELAEAMLQRGAPFDAEGIAQERSRLLYVWRAEEHGRVFDLLRERGYQPSNREMIQWKSRWLTKTLSFLLLALLLVLFVGFATVVVTAIVVVQFAMLPFLLGAYMWRRARAEGPRLFRSFN